MPLLTRYTLTLTPSKPCRSQPEWGYRLYAALLAEAPADYAAALHRDGTTPLSQYLTRDGERLNWHVTLLGEDSEAVFSPILEGKREFRLRKDGVALRVAERSCAVVADVEDLFARCARGTGLHRLEMRTPCAFKRHGQYQILPDTRLLLQSLVKQWNGCFLNCPVEDEDGQGIEAMAEGLWCRSYRLHDQSFYLKGNHIPGFVGEITLDNQLTGFHRTLADALLYFSGYAGLGIKTTLGMGGVRHQFCAE